MIMLEEGKWVAFASGILERYRDNIIVRVESFGGLVYIACCVQDMKHIFFCYQSCWCGDVLIEGAL